MEGYTSNELFVGNSELSSYGKDNPKRWIPHERALRFIDEFKRAGVLGVQFTGGGEPTVHPHHEEVFQRALDAGLKCALVSNGLRWSQRLKQDILPQFAWVRVSIDAGTPDTYSRIRQTPVGNFEKVLANTRSLAQWIQSSGSDCYLGVGWVVTKDNWRELIEGVAAAQSTGARYVRLSAEFNPQGVKPYLDIWDDIKALIAEAKRRYESDSFKIVDLFRDRMQDLEDGPPDYPVCAHQHYTHYIGGDMQAYRCCVLAYNTRGKVAGGDLTSRPFDEWWASGERKEDFESFDARGCKFCQFNDKNRRVNALLDINPTHKEFP